MCRESSSERSSERSGDSEARDRLRKKSAEMKEMKQVELERFLAGLISKGWGDDRSR